ncbi:MAG: sulfatase-like hydrolase/transferase [Verrucomicrobiota bacterium]
MIADDQSPFDFKFYNPRSTLHAPVIEQLAADGMVFDGAYHMGAYSGAVCKPSRMMVMTGRTVWNLTDSLKNRPDGNRPTNAQWDEEIKGSMPVVFNNAGYDTMRTCKKGNSHSLVNDLFTVVHDATKRKGGAEDGSEWHGERVLDYLKDRQARKDDDPFLIYYGFSHPHDPRYGPDDLLAKYHSYNHEDRENPPVLNPKAPPLPINYLSGHPFPDGHPNLRDEFKVPGVWEWRDEGTIRNEIGRQFACSENIDIQVGRVIDQLEAMGELDNTYIIYTADHGMAIGRHGLQGKQNLYEHTWRVPFIVKGPGLKAGSRAQGNIYLLDVLGTLCDLAGIEKPAKCESQSFRPILEGKKDKLRVATYGVYCGGTKPGMRSVRMGDWKLIKYDTLDGEVRKTQLFNLKDNPHEFLQEHHDPEKVASSGAEPKPNQRNLADDPKFANKLKEMEAALLKKMQRHGDPYRLWDQK